MFIVILSGRLFRHCMHALMSKFPALAACEVNLSVVYLFVCLFVCLFLGVGYPSFQKGSVISKASMQCQHMKTQTNTLTNN
jgi:hypothetical protein